MIFKEIPKNSVLLKFYEDFSIAIKNAYEKYEACIKENAKKERIINPPDSIVICRKNNKNVLSLESFQNQFKSAPIQDTMLCDYLLYWMSDKIAECKYNTHRIIWLINLFGELWKSSNCCEKKQGTNDHICEKPFLIELDTNVLKNKKQLYQFIENYNYIKNTLKKENSERKKTYCKYVKYIFELYHLMYNEDTENVQKKYNKELTLFRNNFENEEKLSELKTGCNYPNLSVKLQIEENNGNLSSKNNFVRFIPVTHNLSNYVIETPDVMENILGNTPSYKLYKEFESVEIDAKENQCSKKYFKESSTYQNDALIVCKKIIKNFDKLYEGKIITKADNRCLHYKNWVYSEIWKVISTKSNYSNVGKIINEFLDIQKENNVRNTKNKDVCHYYFIFKDIIELNSKKEEKDLHDYFLNHSFIEENISTVKNDQEQYKKYLGYIMKLYERHKRDWKCCSESGVDPLCVHYFKCEEEYNPSDLLEILNGANKETVKMKYKNIPLVRIGEKKKEEDPDGENVMRIQFGRCSRIYDPNDKKKVVSLRCDYRASRDHFDNFYKKLPDWRNKDSEKTTTSTSVLPVNTSDFSNMSNIVEEDSNTVSYKIPMSVALGIGTVFVFLLYYKFTPFGSLFGKRSRGKICFEDDFNEEYMTELYDGSEYEDVNPGNRRIHIAYQRA
ncbi:PIR protein [Plasmodium ovale]|uniref:PIR protein n=1 Tax=Plasmodium ovale TaxID=36330 RepID=A0A1D3JGB0_PLAOA|nr:PIR protein [Plasmodium ovale]